MKTMLPLCVCLLSFAAVPAAARGQGDGEAKVVLEAKGYVVPGKIVQVSPVVSGRVNRLHFDLGQKVKQGDVLAVIEDAEYKTDLNRALALLRLAEGKLAGLAAGTDKALLAVAEAELAEVVAGLQMRKRDLERAKAIGKGITREEYDQILAAYESQTARVAVFQAKLARLRAGTSREALATARAEVEAATAEVARAKWRLDGCRILAPIDGTVLATSVVEGQLVNHTAFIGTAGVCNLADLTKLEVEVYVLDEDLPSVAVGQKCQVRAPAFRDRVYQGEVARVLPWANRAKGTVPVRVRVTVPAGEDGQFLRPELAVIVSFLARPKAEK